MAISTSTAVALALAAAASGAQYYNTKNTAKKQDRQLASQIESNAKKQKQASDVTEKLVDQYAGSNPDKAKASLRDQYMQQLSAAAGQAKGGLAAPGTASDRFKADAKAAALGLDENAAIDSDLAATLDSARLQREDEGIASRRAGTELGLIQRASQGDNFLDKLRLDAIRRNPGLDAFSSLAGAYAGSMGSFGGAGATPGPVTREAIPIPKYKVTI